MPSIACLEQTRPEEWEYHFVLVQPNCFHTEEEAAAAQATAALEEAFQERESSGSDLVMAEHLRAAGYVSVKGFGLAEAGSFQ